MIAKDISLKDSSASFLLFWVLLVSCLFCFSCKTLPLEGIPSEEGTPMEEAPSVRLMGRGTRNAGELAEFFAAQGGTNPRAIVPDHERIERALRLAPLYVEECLIEGVNWDVAFVQMCLETGYLGFGGLVLPEMNNFCGLGAIGPEQPGLSFPDERTGVRAHVQHLKAYGSAEPLKQECVDPRYKYVQPKGKAPDVFGLAGTWASDREYGVKLASLLERLRNRN